MTELHTHEPIRLLDDPDLDSGLRHDLELACSTPIAYSVDAGLARFEQTLHGASTVPPGGSVAGLRVLGWFVGAVALLGGVGYLSFGRGPESGSTADTIAQVEPAGGDPMPAPTPVPIAEPAEPSEPAVVLPQPVADVEPPPAEPTVAPLIDDQIGLAKPTTPATKASKPSVPAPSLADEAAQVNAARKALASDPAKALALMEAAEQQFPKGAMLQERRGYTILALAALGRTADADERADAYLDRWPNGPLSRRVRDALGR